MKSIGMALVPLVFVFLLAFIAYKPRKGEESAADKDAKSPTPEIKDELVDRIRQKRDPYN